MDKTHSLSSSLDHNQIQHSERSDYDLAYNELIENGFTEEEIAKWFVYSSVQKAFVPTPEYQQRMDSIRRLREKEKNLYWEAVKAGIGELYQSEYIESIKNQQQRDWEFEEQCQAYERELQQDLSIERENEKGAPEFYYDEELELHQSRLSALDLLGFHAISTADDYRVFSYTIHGYKYSDCESLYHYDKLVGIFFDERYCRGPRLPRQEHIDRLLKIALKHKLRLLLVYWESNEKPVWEVYVHTIFVRKQSNVYSYDGLLFDEEKLYDMNKIIKDAKGSGIDIGEAQKLLLQRVVDAPRKIVNREELEVRIEEDVRQHGELADLVSLMQKKSSELSKAVQKMSINGDISVEEQQKAYDLLDAYTATLPQVSVMNFKKQAKKIYNAIFDSLSPSSQMYLTTAAALESVITNENFDICPIYAELGRVLENELDLRIFTEYIHKLKELKRRKNRDIKAKIKEGPFQKIQNNLRAAGNMVFIPEANKLNALPELLNTTEDGSIFETELNAIIECRGYNKELLCSAEQNKINQQFVKNRNEHTHPNPNMDMEHELMNLEQFKEETIARLSWLIEATQSEAQD